MILMGGLGRLAHSSQASARGAESSAISGMIQYGTVKWEGWLMGVTSQGRNSGPDLDRQLLGRGPMAMGYAVVPGEFGRCGQLRVQPSWSGDLSVLSSRSMNAPRVGYSLHLDCERKNPDLVLTELGKNGLHEPFLLLLCCGIRRRIKARERTRARAGGYSLWDKVGPWDSIRVGSRRVAVSRRSQSPLRRWNAFRRCGYGSGR